MEPRLEPPAAYWDEDYDEDWGGDKTYEAYEVTLRDTEKALNQWEKHRENNDT